MHLSNSMFYNCILLLYYLFYQSILDVARALTLAPDSDELKKQLLLYTQKYEEVEGKAYVHIETNDDNVNDKTSTTTPVVSTTTASMNGSTRINANTNTIDTAVDMKPISTRNIYKDYSTTTTPNAVNKDDDDEFTTVITMKDSETACIATSTDDMFDFLHTQGYSESSSSSSLLLSSGAYTREEIPSSLPSSPAVATNQNNENTNTDTDTEESFTRVMIIDEDEEDEEEDGDDDEPVDSNFVRVQITEGEGEDSSDDNEDEEDRSNNVPISSTSTATGSFTRIQIQDDNNDNDDDDDEDLNNSNDTNNKSTPSIPSLPTPAAAAPTTQANDWKEQGNKYMTQKDYLKAIDCYTQSIATDPSLVAAYNNRSLSYIALRVSFYVSDNMIVLYCYVVSLLLVIISIIY